MNALLLSQYKHLEIATLPVPVAEPFDVLVQVAACGICGSDVHGYDGTSGRRIPPIVMGHEAAGIVAAVGSEVSGFAVGDRVTFDSTVYCGVCDFCRKGEVNLCDNRQVVGVSCGDYRRAGAFAEYVAVPARIVYKLPENLAFAEAAMLEAVSVALHAVAVCRTRRRRDGAGDRCGHDRTADPAGCSGCRLLSGVCRGHRRDTLEARQRIWARMRPSWPLGKS